jgi:hypothetical protein
MERVVSMDLEYRLSAVLPPAIRYFRFVLHLRILTPAPRKVTDDSHPGNPDIQWQSEYEAAQNNQTPRTPVEQMTQQFGAVNIRSPEQTVGDEQNSTFCLELASYSICTYFSLNAFVD